MKKYLTILSTTVGGLAGGWYGALAGFCIGKATEGVYR